MPTPSVLPDNELEEEQIPSWWRRFIAFSLRTGARVGRGLRRIRENNRR